MKSRKPAARAAKIDRRAKIVDSAISLFISKGFAETRAIDVAKKAKVDQQLVRYHFPTLDLLYTEVVQRIIEDLNAFVFSRLPKDLSRPEEVLKDYVLAYFGWVHEKPGYGSIFLYFYYLATFKDVFAGVNRLTRESGRERLAGLVYRGIESGAFKPRLAKPGGVDELAFQLQALIIGGLVVTFTERVHDWEARAGQVWGAASELLGIRT